MPLPANADGTRVASLTYDIEIYRRGRFPGVSLSAEPVAEPPVPDSPSDRKSPRPDPTSALVPVAIGDKVFVAQVKIKETAKSAIVD